MKIINGQKLLVLRYSTEIIDDCIEMHQATIEKTGACWFGKIGKIPSPWMLEAVFSEEAPMVILYNRKGAYLCRVSDFSYSIRNEQIPDYYFSELYERYLFPDSFYKLDSIEKINLEEYPNLVVNSTKKPLIDTLNGKAMSSFFFVVNGVDYSFDRSKVHQTGRFDRIKIGSDDCRYRKNGMCANKSFINFGYECDKPQKCAKQSFK